MNNELFRLIHTYNILSTFTYVHTGKINIFFLILIFFFCDLQEEAQYDVLVAEVELLTERMKEEKERMKKQEQEEKKGKEILTNAQVKERMLQREGIFFLFHFVS